MDQIYLFYILIELKQMTSKIELFKKELFDHLIVFNWIDSDI